MPCSSKPPQAKQPYRQHGLAAAARAMDEGRLPAPIRAEMAERVQAVGDDLGGDEHLSDQQRTIIELAARTRYLLGVADAFLAEKASGRSSTNATGGCTASSTTG